MYEVYVDGSHRPEASCAAVVMYKFRKEEFRTVKPVQTNSNVAAEAEAILLGVTLSMAMGSTNPTIYSDSQVIVDQFYRKRNVRSRSSLQYLVSLWEMQKIYPFILKFVPRREVFVPDSMCDAWIKNYKKVLKSYD